MSLNNYANFQAAIADQLARSDLTNQIIDCITLFEAEASRVLFKNRLTEKTTILIPSNPALITVSNAVSNGGLIRLTVTSTSTYSTGQEVNVASVGGTTEANGSWIVTVINGTTLDLQGSTFTNTYVSGGTVQALPGIVTLPSDYWGWRRVTWTGSPAMELEYAEPEVLHAYYPLSQTVAGDPQYFSIEGTTLTVRPWSGTPIEFDYYAATAALSSSLNWLFNNHVDCYWNGVLQEVYSYLKDYDQAGIYQQKKSADYDGIKAQRFREGGGLTIKRIGVTP